MYTKLSGFVICLYMEYRLALRTHLIKFALYLSAMNIERNTPAPRCNENVLAIVIGRPTFGNVRIMTYKKPETPGLQQITVRILSLSPEEASRSLMRAMKLDSLWVTG